MDAYIRDCLVTGFEDLIPTVKLPDEKDRHALAVAVRAGADVIVTFNLKHFPAEHLQPYGIESPHPDVFFEISAGSRSKYRLYSRQTPASQFEEEVQNCRRVSRYARVARSSPNSSRTAKVFGIDLREWIGAK